MKPIGPTTSSASFAPQLLPDKITLLFQRFAPYGNQGNPLCYDRLAIILFVVSSIAYVFYTIFFAAGARFSRLQTDLEKSILELKKLQDEKNLTELQTSESSIMKLNETIQENCKCDKQKSITFGNILRGKTLHHLSLDDLCVLYKALKAHDTPQISELIEELIWEKMGDENAFSQENPPFPLFCVQLMQPKINGNQLSDRVPNPEKDPFFWALVLQYKPDHPERSNWEKTIQTLLASPEDPMDFLGPSKEDYTLKVSALEAQNSAESGWAKRRLEAYRYLASVQKT